MGSKPRHSGAVDSASRREISLRSARPDDAQALSAIARAAKAHWGYGEALLALWAQDLTITPELIRRDQYRVAERDGRPVAFLALAGEGPDLSIEHLWVLPEAKGDGVGGRLLTDALARCRDAGTSSIRIVSDPNAAGFYARFGAREIGSVPSRPAPRQLPLLEIRLAPPIATGGDAAASSDLSGSSCASETRGEGSGDA